MVTGTTYVGICFGTTGILFASGNPVYIILKGMAAKDTPFEDNVNSVAVKRDPAFIVRDQFYTAGNKFFSLKIIKIKYNNSNY